MARDVRTLRELMSLARLLRTFAEKHRYDPNHELFVATALALEARAHFLAATPQGTPMDMDRDMALHAPVNRLV